jgi:hypothetical protein
MPKIERLPHHRLQRPQVLDHAAVCRCRLVELAMHGSSDLDNAKRNVQELVCCM